MAKRRSDAERRIRQSQRLGRTLRLLCLIQERNSSWNLDSLAQELSCSRKTIQRDLQVLEAAGIPYFYDEVGCCYRVRPDFRMKLLDAPSGQSKGVEADPPSGPEDKPQSPLMVAEISQELAQRLLSEAERLVQTLGQLCQALRPSSQSSLKDPPSEAK